MLGNMPKLPENGPGDPRIIVVLSGLAVTVFPLIDTLANTHVHSQDSARPI